MRFISKTKDFFLTADNFLIYENKIWFSELDCNELYCYDLYDGSIHMICKLDAEMEYQHRLFGGLIAYNKKIYMLPFSARQMYEVDILTGQAKRIELKVPDVKLYLKYNEKGKFLSGHNFENCIYLIGATYPSIVEYNCSTGSINYYDTWVKELCHNAKNERRAFFRKTAMIGSKIYAPTCMGNYVMEFDVKTHKHIFYTVGSEKSAYSSICQVDNWMWLSPIGKGPVVKWNRYTNQWKEYWNFPKGYVANDFSFGDIVCFGNYVYCIPLYSNMLIRIATQGEFLEEYKLENINATDLSACIANCKMYLFSQRSGQFIVLDDKNCKIRELLMPKQQEKYHIEHASRVFQISTKQMLSKEYIYIYECFPAELAEYIQFVLQNNSLRKNMNSDFSKGQAIYKRMIKGE